MDIFAEAEGLKRRRALLEALAAKAAAPQITGAHGLGQLFAHLGTSAIAKDSLRDVEQRQSENQGRYQNLLSQEFDRFMQTREGVEGEGAESDRYYTPGTPGDPKKAVYQALASRLPEMQEVGKAGIREMTMKPPKPTVTWTTVRLPRQDGSMGLYRLSSDGKLESVDNPGVSVNMTQEKALSAKSAESAIAGVDTKSDSYKEARTAQKDMAKIPEILYNLNNGAKPGFAGEIRLGFGKFGELLGIPSSSTMPSSVLGALLAERVFTRLGGLGVAVSDADRVFVQQAAGSLETNPKALKVLLANQLAANMLEVNRHKNAVHRIPDDLAKANFDLSFKYEMPTDDPVFEQMVLAVLKGRSASEVLLASEGAGGARQGGASAAGPAGAASGGRNVELIYPKGRP